MTSRVCQNPFSAFLVPSWSLMSGFTLVAITGTNILLSYPLSKVTGTHLRSGAPKSNLLVPDLRMSCRDLTTWQGTRIVAVEMATRWHYLIDTCSVHSIPDIRSETLRQRQDGHYLLWSVIFSFHEPWKKKSIPAFSVLHEIKRLLITKDSFRSCSWWNEKIANCSSSEDNLSCRVVTRKFLDMF